VCAQELNGSSGHGHSRFGDGRLALSAKTSKAWRPPTVNSLVEDPIGCIDRRVTTLTDRTVEQIKELAEEIRIAERTLAELGQQRRAAVGRLRDEGWSYQQIADALGVTRSRAQQLSK